MEVQFLGVQFDPTALLPVAGLCVAALLIASSWRATQRVRHRDRPTPDVRASSPGEAEALVAPLPSPGEVSPAVPSLALPDAYTLEV
jgi:hypothetical protein